MSRRDEILKAAEELLEHYGVNKTTMADIARRVGISVGSLYLDFESKDAIIEALAARRHDRILQELREAAQSGRTYADRIEAFFDARFQAFLRMAESGEHAFELVHCSCHGVESAWTTYREREARMLCNLLEEGIERGDLDVPDPQLTCEAIFNIYATFSPPHVFREKEGRIRILKETHHIVLRGLLRR